jgi:hypothetical protein
LHAAGCERIYTEKAPGAQRDPEITVEEVARRLRVGAATLYRYGPRY